MPKKPQPRGGLPAYAANVRRLLRERDITHVAFSKKVGLSPQSMYAALNGGDIRVSTLLRMANALAVSPHTLLLTEADIHHAEVAQPQQPNLLTLLAALMAGGAAPQQPMPTAAQEFLNYWSKLDARDIHTLTHMAKTLAHNRVVDASFRMATNDIDHSVGVKES